MTDAASGTRLHDLFCQTIRSLRAVAGDSAESEATLLLGHCLGLSRTAIHLHGERGVDDNGRLWLESCVQRRLSGEPCHYVIGEREFWSLDFEVGPGVLIPRPETELLVETVLGADRLPWTTTPLLDLCCGSGVMAVVLARELAGAVVVAVDLSMAALEVAHRNARRHGVADRVHFLCADLLSALRPGARFSAIVSNPPYVAAEEMADLAPEVRDHEPRLALDGGPAGMVLIERIAATAPDLLAPGGLLCIEIGADQEKAVLASFAGLAARLLDKHFDTPVVLRDHAGLARILRLRRI